MISARSSSFRIRASRSLMSVIASSALYFRGSLESARWKSSDQPCVALTGQRRLRGASVGPLRRVLAKMIDRKQLLRPLDAAQCVAADGDEFRAFAAAGGCVELGGRQRRLSAGPAHRCDPANLVHGRTDDGEIEPFVTADVA